MSSAEDIDAILDREAEISRAFSPTAPVDRRDLFSGRTSQIRSLMEVVNDRGRHGVIYGERGVGKTSLAHVGAQIVTNVDVTAIKVNCGEDDTFETIWRKALSRVHFSHSRTPAGFEADASTESFSADRLLAQDATSHDLEMAVSAVTQQREVVIFIDEFDRVKSTEVHRKMTDAIKAFSDQGLRCTVVFVGVADDVGQLVAEHASIERALKQIQMPRMSEDELNDVIDRGLGSVDMTIIPAAKERIVRLSQGLPHYTHLLAQESAKCSIYSRGAETVEVDNGDVFLGMKRAVEGSPQTLTQRYHQATSSPRKSTLYPDVVLAAALAKGDELGYFAPAQIREPLRAITGNRGLEIPAFSQHLHQLCEADRGTILQRSGAPRRYRFRFTNPLMQPYALMKALSSDEQKDVVARLLL